MIKLVLACLITASLVGCTPSGSSHTTASTAAGGPDTEVPAGPMTANTIAAKAQDKCLNLVNGQTLTAREMPAVVYIARPNTDGTTFGVCTATFVSPTTLITAGHCVDSSSSGNVYYYATPPDGSLPPLDGSGVKALKSFTGGYTFESVNAALSNSVIDVAVVIFPANTAPASMPLAPARPSPGTMAVLVGFGQKVLDGQTPDAANPSAKAAGSTAIIATPTDTFVGTKIAALLVTGGQTINQIISGGAATTVGAHGDSGMPLLVDNAITAVFNGETSGTVGSSSTIYQRFTDVNSPEVQQIIAQAVQNGAVVPVQSSGELTQTAATAAASATTAGATSTPTSCE